MSPAAPGRRQDPYSAFNFWVEIKGLVVAGFSQVSGLKMEVDVQTYAEGGVNNFTYQFPGRVKQNTITLKRGMADSDTIWQWCYGVAQGVIVRKNLSIYLLDNVGEPVVWWNVMDAWPVRWEGPEFRATSSEVAMESLTLAHHGMMMLKA